ncbi:MAG: hypothetical protein P1P64_08580, partial [Treponemataceae bacterium]
QDFWIRFLGNYQSDAETKALQSLCKKNEGVNMANEVLLTVTEEERQIARELSEYKYQLMVQSERAEARKEGLTEGKLEKARETARKMKYRGFNTSDISDLTGLSKAEIEKL